MARKEKRAMRTRRERAHHATRFQAPTRIGVRQ